MAQRTKLAAVLSGLVQNVDLTADELVVSSLRTGGLSGSLLTDAILARLISLQNGTDVDATYHTHDGRYYTESELASATSSSGSDLIGDDNTYSSFTPAAATVKGAHSGIDTALGATFSKDGSRAATGNFDLGGNRVTNMGAPSAGSDAATKTYVDNAINGLDWKQSVRAATTAAGTLATDYENGDSIDGVTLATGNRILIKNQASGAENGIYTVNASGAPTRATDADTSGEVTAALAVFVEEGTTYADTGWVLTTDNPITLGTTALTFAQFSGAGAVLAGTGLTKSGNTINFNTADTSLTVNADDAAVNLNTTGGLETSSGVRIKSDTATANTIGVTTTANGAGTKFDSNSFADSGSETLALASGVAGSGLALTTGVLSVNVDDSTIEINSDTLRVKDAGITLAKLASNSVDENKLTTSVAGNGLAGGGGSALSVNVDGSTLEINADALRVKDAGITLAKLASNSVDENKLTTSVAGAGLTGGGGSALAVGAGTGISVAADSVSVDYAPQMKKTMVAGEAFAANTSFLVRMAVNGETAGRVYKADQTSAASAGKFWAIGFALSTGAVSTGGNIDVTLMGTHTLGSSDTPFGGTDIGKAVWLSSSTGGFSITPPSTSGEADYKMGTVETTTKVFVDGKQLTGIA